MALRLPRLPTAAALVTTAGLAKANFQQWWQSVVKAVEEAFDTLEAAIAAIAAAQADIILAQADIVALETSKQDADPTLTALAAYSTVGILTLTAPDTFAGRTLTAPASGLTISNPAGTAGNPTFALANDLAALEALSGTNTIYYRSGADTWSAVTIGSGLSFSAGSLTCTVSPGTGSVTSVGLALPAEFDISGSPVTTAGTLTGAWANQTTNKVFAAPNGSTGTPTFRALVAADIPTLNQSTSGSAATLTTTRSIAMTGDVAWTVNFNGSANVTAAGTIANDAVTYAKMQNVSAASKLLGRGSAGGSGDPEEITLGTNLAMSGTTLNASSGAGTGSAGWTLIDTTGAAISGSHSWTSGGAVPSVDFIGLANYSDVLVVARAVVLGTSGVLSVRLSTDNGVSFYALSGDYIGFNAVGTEASFAQINLFQTITTSARGGWLLLNGLKTSGGYKSGMKNGNQASTETQNILFVASTLPVTALRVIGSNGGNITAGTLDVYAR